jgi:predicted acylesterase/phospholipase RssA
LIETYIDQEMMERIAEEHLKGRELSIGTTNLDSMRPVIWRIGRIANSGHPRALELIHQILLASASIPGVQPPTRDEDTSTR